MNRQKINRHLFNEHRQLILKGSNGHNKHFSINPHTYLTWEDSDDFITIHHRGWDGMYSFPIRTIEFGLTKAEILKQFKVN